MIEQWEKEEIAGYRTQDIQADLPGLIKTFGMNDELVIEFISVLKSRNAKITLTEPKQDKWYHKSTFKDTEPTGQATFYHASYAHYKIGFPTYSDMVSGQRWHWCWTRNREGQVVIHFYFTSLDKNNRERYGI